MYIVWALSWWYGAGLFQRLRLIRQRFVQWYDYFSIDLLLKTWFSPFRQISAGKIRGPLAVQWRAFVDRLVSRIIGAIVRTLVILIGLVTMLFVGIISLVTILAWIVAPLAPLIGFVAMLAGWTVL